MDPAQNADYAAGMISGLLAKYQGNVHRALSAYNAGDPDATGTATQWGDGKRLGYADSVMAHYAQLTGGAATPAAAGRTDAPATGESGLTLHESAVAEMSSLLASLGALQSQAQGFPSLPAPAQPSQPPQMYRQQVTDYAGLLAGDTDN
jgi:hypothetical protein